jgi:hypothetical protein
VVVTELAGGGVLVVGAAAPAGAVLVGAVVVGTVVVGTVVVVCGGGALTTGGTKYCTLPNGWVFGAPRSLRSGSTAWSGSFDLDGSIPRALACAKMRNGAAAWPYSMRRLW